MRPLRIIPAMLILGLLAPGTATAEDDPLNINVEEALYHQCKEMEDRGIAFARECWAVHKSYQCLNWVYFDPRGAEETNQDVDPRDFPIVVVWVAAGTEFVPGPYAHLEFRVSPSGVKCDE